VIAGRERDTSRLEPARGEAGGSGTVIASSVIVLGDRSRPSDENKAQEGTPSRESHGGNTLKSYCEVNDRRVTGEGSNCSVGEKP